MWCDTFPDTIITNHGRDAFPITISAKRGYDTFPIFSALAGAHLCACGRDAFPTPFPRLSLRLRAHIYSMPPGNDCDAFPETIAAKQECDTFSYARVCRSPRLRV